jgi:hypothetical protein
MATERHIRVASRFCGPPGSANGGYVAGLVAQAIGSLVTVRLLRPPPLETDLALVAAEEPGHWAVLHGTQRVIEARPGTLDLIAPPPPTYVEALEASLHAPGLLEHPCPGCFVCGPGRARGDGLRLFASPVSGRDIAAAPWLPDESLSQGDGKVRPEFIAAALDCPGFHALRTGRRLWLLGEYTCHIDRLVHVGEPCVISAWQLTVRGRVATVGTALFDEDGQLCAMARGTWIEPRPAAQSA